MEFFLQLALNGLVVGSIYSLVALGFVIIYKASGILNFAQGEPLDGRFAQPVTDSLHHKTARGDPHPDSSPKRTLQRIVARRRHLLCHH